MEWCDVEWCDVEWCDVEWCDVEWCDVEWCDVECGVFGPVEEEAAGCWVDSTVFCSPFFLT